MGDPAGIGPEIIAAAAAMPIVRRSARLVVYGDPEILAAAARERGCGSIERSAIVRVEAVTRRKRGRPRPSRWAGGAAFAYLDAAARAVLEGRYAALVTAPINKYWMNRAGHDYDGHTGYLSALCGARAVMMLAGRRLRVVLVTTHLAIADVPRALSAGAIEHAGRTTHEHLRRYWGVARPRLAMAALNPHAGEGGLFGDEEARVLVPAARRLRRRRISIEGPLAADTLFAAAVSGDYDAVLCMYHDQALIPLKLVEFGRAVNVSMGLPIIRTSPDHGTAYELAGRGTARADSMAAAIVAAAKMAARRQRR